MSGHWQKIGQLSRRTALAIAAQIAQAEAESAHNAAGDAQRTADSAMTMAGTKSTVHYDTDPPSGTAETGDVWRQRDGDKNVVAEWFWDSGWQKSQVTSEMVSNLDVGKLSVGAAEIAELVSLKIAAAVGAFVEADIGNLTVTGESRLADVVASQIAADTARFMELEVGKLVASEGILDEAVINQLFTEVVMAQMVHAEAFIGTNAILEGSITAESGIIGSLDLGVAIVGKLHGQYVEAGSIDTEQLAFGAATGDVLSVDALNFKTAVGLDIRSSAFRAGDAVEITEDFGIRQFGPDGALNVSLPSDGSPAEFRGDLSARTLTATGRMSIQGPGAIASGGVLELESGVVPPVGPPSVSNYLQTTKFPPVADDESVWGLAWVDGHWWRAVDVAGMSEGDRIEKITPTGGLVSSFPIVFYPRNGMTAIGDELFLLGIGDTPGVDKYTSRRFVRVYGLDGTFKRQWEYEQYGTGTYQPGIGTDGTNILIAQPWQDGRLTWRRFNKTTGALLAQVDSDQVVSSSVNAITQTAGDFGKQQVVITWGNMYGSNSVYETSGASVPDAGWFANHRQEVRGTVFKDGHFYHITVGGDLVKMSGTRFPNGEPSVDTDDWWAAITWSDGTYETTLGPARQFMNRRRHDNRVSFGSPPEGATRARVYFARGVTEPSRTSFHRVGEVDATAEQSIIVQPIGWESLANPPASNTFPQSSPGLIRSALGNFRVDGTGVGQWGPLTFHADGTMDGVPRVATGDGINFPDVPPDSAQTLVVTFPAGRFTKPPGVSATTSQGRITPVVFNITKDSFSFRAWNFTGTTAYSVVGSWLAVEEV